MLHRPPAKYAMANIDSKSSLPRIASPSSIFAANDVIEDDHPPTSSSSPNLARSQARQPPRSTSTPAASVIPVAPPHPRSLLRPSHSSSSLPSSTPKATPNSALRHSTPTQEKSLAAGSTLPGAGSQSRKSVRFTDLRSPSPAPSSPPERRLDEDGPDSPNSPQNPEELLRAGGKRMMEAVEELDDTVIATFLLEALTLHEKGDSLAYLNILESLDPRTSSHRDMSSSASAPSIATAQPSTPVSSAANSTAVPDSAATATPANARGLSTAALTKWVRSFSAVVSSLTPRLAPLVDLILRLDWLDRGQKFVGVYGQFLENLVSAHAFYVVPVVRMLVGSFRAVPPALMKKFQKASASAGDPSASPGPAMAAISKVLSSRFDHIHGCLRGVLSLIPSGLSFMVPILAEHFPHKTETVEDNVWYLRNMIRVAGYAPMLRGAIWSLAVDRAVQIDVEIQSALDDLDDDDYNAVVHHCFDPDSLESQQHRAVDPVDLSPGLPPLLFPSSASRLAGSEANSSDADSDSDSESDDDDDDYGGDFDLSDGFESDSDESTSAPPEVVHNFQEMSGKLDSMLNLLMGQAKESLTAPPPPS
ncbi:hypothetical protein HDU96_001064, partial [Phlyctochytrium bullatum]